MGIQINGTNDVISAADGSLTVLGTELKDLSQLNVTGVATAATLVVSGNASIGGTITYMDVSNVDSVGIITAQQGLQVLANGLDVTGIITATAGNTSNYAIIANNSNSSGDQNYLQFKAGATVIGDINRPNGTNNIELNAGYGSYVFGTGTSGTATEKLRIHSSGQLQVAGTDLTNINANADDLVIGEHDNATERGITLASTAGAGIRFNDGANAGIIEYNHSSNFMRFYVNESEKVRISGANANYVVGIGTNNPESILHTAKPPGTYGSMAAFNSQKGDVKLRIDDLSNSATAQRVYLTHNQSRGGGGFANDDSGYGIASIGFDDGSITLGTNASGNTTTSARITILSSGEVNIGDSASQTTYLSEISGPYNKAGLRVVSGAPGYSDPFVVATSTGGERFRITGSGNVGIATASPGARLHVYGNAVGFVTTLTDGATITPNFASANNFTVTLGGNRTLANPTNIVAGQSGFISIVQDGTGSRTLGFGTFWDFASGTAPTLTTTAAAVDVLAYYARSTTNIVADVILNLS